MLIYIYINMLLKSHAFTIHFNMTELSTLRLHIVALKAGDVHRFPHIIGPFCHGSCDCNQHTNHRLLAVLTFIPELVQGKTNAGNPYMIHMHLGRKMLKPWVFHGFSRGFTPKKNIHWLQLQPQDAPRGPGRTQHDMLLDKGRFRLSSAERN